MPKDMANVPQGVSTYGIWEYVSYIDDIVFNSWMYCADFNNMGLCGGLVLVTLATRMVIMPVTMYSQITAYKLRLLQPDMNEGQAKMRRYAK